MSKFIQGESIRLENEKLNVPNHPVIPFIEGDGIGVEVMDEVVKIINFHH